LEAIQRAETKVKTEGKIDYGNRLGALASAITRELHRV
jgi:hypothetical protein